MLDIFSRSELLIGEENIKKLNNKRVAVFGVGGVGGIAVEALVRSGIGHIDIVDNDTVSITNLNRQIIATKLSVGKFKVDLFKERINDINPDCEVNAIKKFYLPQNRDEFDFKLYDYVIDAVDTVSAKIDLIVNANENNIKIISAMGAANKLDPSKLCVGDLSNTSYCPLARVMRRELKKRGINKCKVVYSNEPAVKVKYDDEQAYNDKRSINPSLDKSSKRSIPGSMMFVPAIAGLLIANEVIRDLIYDE